MTHSEARSQTRASANTLLRAQIVVEPDCASHCGVVQKAEDGAIVNQQLKPDDAESGFFDRESGSTSGECHTVLRSDSPEANGDQYVVSKIAATCICPVFTSRDCVPTIKRVDGRRVTFSISFQDREELRGLIEDLRRVDASVSVDWLVSEGETPTTAEIDVSEITTKQQEALETARALGYYDTPRQTDLSSIATELEISESAVSQRLNAAETKLVQSFLGI